MGARLGEFITRLRGNPVALSTLLVAAVAAFGGWALVNRNPNPEVLAGALIGAAVSSLVGLLITFLGEPDVRAIPRPFLEAVKHELAESGYYRSNHRYSITLTERSPIHIQITFSSKIVPSGGNTRVKAPLILPSEGLSIIRKEYKVDGHSMDFGAEFELKTVKSEICSVTYRVDKLGIDIKETHRWTSPIDGFILTVHLPHGYAVHAVTLAGLALEEETAHIPEERIFLRKEVAFSQQGVVWSITKAEA